MSGIPPEPRQHATGHAVTVARLPRNGVIPILLLITMILGPGLLSPEFSASWLFRVGLVLLIVMRATMVRLIVTNSEVVVTNFFRTIRVPINEAFAQPEQPKVGYLELTTTDNQTISVGAAPSWGFDLGHLREQFLDEVHRRRGWR